MGQPTYLGYFNGRIASYGYEPLNRLTLIRHQDGGTVLSSFAYGFDPASNVMKTTYADGAYWSYAYDGRYRLTKAERYDATPALLHRYTYTYSAGDNLLTKEVCTASTATTETTALAYDAANELQSGVTGSTTTTYGYDA